MAGKQLDRGNLVHRFSQCPSLSRELQQALKSYESSMIAGLQELGEAGLPEDFGFSEDFNVETDGWGDLQADVQRDELSDPRNNHPLARAAQQSAQFQDGDIIP